MPKLNDIFWIFFKLGCTSFGGPAAHLIFFKQSFVDKKHWLTEQQYDELLALTQLLPGPSSSQMGMAIGYLQQGYLGAIIAWLGFTLPSALLMFVLAYFIQQQQTIDSRFFSSIQSIIFAIVVFAFWQMFKSYCKSRLQFFCMCLSTLLLLGFSNNWMQFAIIIGSGLFSFFIGQSANIRHQGTSFGINQSPYINSRKTSPFHLHPIIWLIVFISIFFVLWFVSIHFNSTLSISSFNFYKIGSLVFGGGHVVLPMLYQDFVYTGMINPYKFELGYTLAQFMPGPLFTFASYMGVLLPLSPYVFFNALLTTLLIFLPSFFFIFAALPYWSKLLNNAYIQNSVSLINAAVVGFLLSILLPLAEKTLINLQNFVIVGLMLISLKLNISVFISVPAIFLLQYLWNFAA
jgi:chromate transporter